MQQILIDLRDGRGLIDYSHFLDRDEAISYRHAKNQPILVDFFLSEVSVDGVEWRIPPRGSYVKIIDTGFEARYPYENGLVFSGYATEDATPVLLGTQGSDPYYRFKMECTSEEFLANNQKLPTVTYVNKTHGDILKDLLGRMFDGVTPQPYDTSGIADGGTEQVFAIDTDKKFSEIAADFAEADGYVYWIIGHYFYYGPQREASQNDDPNYRLVIDAVDPRYSPHTLSLVRVGREIANDITVIGEDEAYSLVNEHFVSDGYQGSHQLAFEPYGVEQSTLIDDDLTGDIDTGTWEEVDPDGFITPFEGKLNITGGPTDDAGTVFLRSRRAIELGGMLECLDGEVSFPSGSATGEAIVGGMFTTEEAKLSALWNGWKIDLDRTAGGAAAPTIYPVSSDGYESSAGYPLVRTRTYLLRRTIHVQQATTAHRSFTQPSTGQPYGGTTVPSSAEVTWTLDEVVDDDPENVYIVSRNLLTKTVHDVPAFVLYAAIVPWAGCQLLLNNVYVTKPQQASVKVNGKTVRVGNFLQGGRCALVTEGGVGKLAWYSVPGNDITHKHLILDKNPRGFWPLSDLGATAIDASGFALNGTLASVSVGADGALGSGNETAMSFNGSSSRVLLPAMATTAAFSTRAWFKSTSSASTLPIWSNRSGSSGNAVYLSAGQIEVRSGSSTTRYSTRAGLNDGAWHRVIVSWDGTNVYIFIDGELDSTQTQACVASSENSAFIGYDAQTTSYFNGSLAYVSLHNEPTDSPSARAEYSRGMSTNAEVVTIPAKGETIEITYYRNRRSYARVRDEVSILAEKAKYGDSGVRQKIIRLDDVTTKPKTSEECQALAEAFVADNSSNRYEGSYSFDVVHDGPSQLRYWPMAGDRIWCEVELPGATSAEQISNYLTIENVMLESVGEDAYRFALEFGIVNRFDLVQREILLRRRTSLDDPIIPEREIDSFEDLVSGTTYPSGLTDVRVSNITATEMTLDVASGGIPDEVVNYEIRTDDTGWGQANYVARFRAASYTLPRAKRDVRYFIRPYNSYGKYARRSAVVRAVYPLQNTLVMSGVDGEITPTTVMIDVPVPRDPDFAGIVVRRDSASGPVIYDGDGAYHREAIAGVDVIVGSGYISVGVPNPDPTSRDYTVHVNTYNILGLFGTAETKTITKVAPEITSAPAVNPIDETIVTWSGTADRWRITVFDYTGGVVAVVILPGTQKWFNVGAYGQQRTITVEAIDDFDEVPGHPAPPPPTSTLPISGDSGAPGAIVLSGAVVTSPNGDGKLAFRLSWTEPATNARLLDEYELEWDDNSSFTSPQGVELSPAQHDFILYEPGQTLYFRARAKGHFGNGPFHVIGPLSTGSALDHLGAGGAWNYSSRLLDKDVRVVDSANTAGRLISEVNDGTGRSLTGLATSGDISRNVPNPIRYIDSIGTQRVFIHNNNAVAALTNGATVETGADRGINAINGSYRLVGNIENAVRYYDNVGVQRVIIHNNNAVASLSDGTTVTGGATRANTGLASNGDVARYIPRTIGGYDGSGNPRTLFLNDYDSMDQVVDGGTYYRTTSAQRDGGGRGYNALNTSNVLTTGVQGDFYYPAATLVEAADRGSTGFERMVAGYQGRVRAQDDVVDGMSVRVEVIAGSHIVPAYRTASDLYEGSGSGFERPPEI